MKMIATPQAHGGQAFPDVTDIERIVRYKVPNAGDSRQRIPSLGKSSQAVGVRGPADLAESVSSPWDSSMPFSTRNLGTSRLLLRPPATADLPHIQRYAVREPFYRYMEMDVPTPESVERYLVAVIAAWEDPHARERVFAIEPTQAERIAGLIRIAIDDEAGKEGSVGFGLDPDFQGRGYATEALRELVRLGFEERGLRRVCCRRRFERPRR